MAQGDFTLFNDTSDYFLRGVFTLSTDTCKVALIDDTTGTQPLATQVDPTWTTYSSGEVSGTNYTTGGAAIANPAVSQVSGSQWKFDGDNVSWTQNASGPTDISWGIVYDDTATSDEAIGFIDMEAGGVAISLAAGNITIQWNASGILLLA